MKLDSSSPLFTATEPCRRFRLCPMRVLAHGWDQAFFDRALGLAPLGASALNKETIFVSSPPWFDAVRVGMCLVETI